MTLIKVEDNFEEFWNVPRYDCSECNGSFFATLEPEPVCCPFCGKRTQTDTEETAK